MRSGAIALGVRVLSTSLRVHCSVSQRFWVLSGLYSKLDSYKWGKSKNPRLLGGRSSLELRFLSANFAITTLWSILDHGLQCVRFVGSVNFNDYIELVSKDQVNVWSGSLRLSSW